MVHLETPFDQADRQVVRSDSDHSTDGRVSGGCPAGCGQDAVSWVGGKVSPPRAVGRPMEGPGEKLRIRIWKTVIEKGIGGLLAPGHKRRMGSAEIDVERRRLLTLAQTEQDVKAIESGTKDSDRY